MKKSDKAIVPIILSAGLSRRMGGHPKALLRFGRMTALGRILRAYRRAGVARPVVVLGHRASEVRASFPPDAARFVLNRNYRTGGQTSSLKRGLSTLAKSIEAFFIHPVDLPLVGEREIRALIAAYRRDREGKAIFIPSYRRHCGHPILLTRRLIPEILALKRDEPLRSVVFRRKDRIAFVPMRSSVVLRDIDTREDYRRLVRVDRRRRS